MAQLLCAVPPEIFLAICGHLGGRDLRALKLASPRLRRLVAAHAAALCNARIAARYAREAALLHSAVAAGGWLVPTHACVLREEEHVRSRHRHLRSSSASASSSSSLTSTTTTTTSSAAASSSACDASPWSSWSSTGSAAAGPRSRLDLSTPGPEYLCFLAEYSFQIRVAEEMFQLRRTQAVAVADGVFVARADDRDQPPPADRFGSWVGLYCVRRFLERLRRLALDEAGCYEHEREEIEWFYA